MKRLNVILIMLGCLTWSVVGASFGKESSNEIVAGGCPQNLSHLSEKAERYLKSVLSERFKKALRASLVASIPDAIQQADGIQRQIAYLRKEIVSQARAQTYAEQVARESTTHLSEELVPCEPGEKGSYCDAVEQYYVAVTSNMANQGFLDALECYQKQGVR